MGITNFHKWLRENYPQSIKSHWIDSYDNVYIDLNFVLHYCYYGVNTITDIYIKLQSYIESILQLLQPQQNVIFATDGTAPLAKLILQRKRRLNISKQNANKDFSSVIFTPGTHFMN